MSGKVERINLINFPLNALTWKLELILIQNWFFVHPDKNIDYIKNLQYNIINTIQSNY